MRAVQFIRTFLLGVLCLLAPLLLSRSDAQEFTASARFLPDESALTDHWGRTQVSLLFSQGVPYRVRTLDNPRRLVLDFKGITWAGADPAALNQSEYITGLRVGAAAAGWSRMVIDLAEPMIISDTDLQISTASGAARLVMNLRKSSEADYAAAATLDAEPTTATQPSTAPRKDGPLRVMLDPGHGGIDPGAETGGVIEKELMLTFARELKDSLLRVGMDVSLTRDADEFVSLERRVALAHAAEADLFISLHADTLTEGRALGTVVYTLSDSASDAATQALVERHKRSDLLAGVDLSNQDDAVANVLLELARQETTPRAQRLADALVLAFKKDAMPINTRPQRVGGFSVLKAADIPSVLIELGFLSSERDRINLQNAEWRAAMAKSIRDAIVAWQIADETIADLVRQ